MCQMGDEEDGAAIRHTGVLTLHGLGRCHRKDESVASSSKGSVDGFVHNLSQLEVG
jgi:hypothetical protein